MDRIIALIDMDCFYVQVEQNEKPEFKGKPCGVAQYNPYKGGGLIAVNYEARKYGIKRGMRGDQCKEMCPEFHTFFVQEKRGKANLTKYRDASMKIFEIILKHCDIVEKASIDEAYLDLTSIVNERLKNIDETIDLLKFLPSTFVVGSYSLENDSDREMNLKAWLNPIKFSKTNVNNNALLAIGALIVEEIRKDVFETLGYNCSAGIANNKTFAKFCCGINKPKKQTLLPFNAIDALMQKTQIQKIRNLGGKLGLILTQELKLEFIGDIAKLNQNYLIDKFGEKTGQWLFQISHGIDLEPVLSRQTAKSVGCSKNFRGKSALDTIKKVEYWIKQLADELEERLEKDKDENKRIASLLVIHITNNHGNFSKSINLISYCAKKITEQTLNVIKIFNKAATNDDTLWYPAINVLGLSASKFKDIENNKEKTIIKFFSNVKPLNKISSESKSENDTKATTSSKANNNNDHDDDIDDSVNNDDDDDDDDDDDTEVISYSPHESFNQNEDSNESTKNCIEIISINNKNIEEVNKKINLNTIKSTKNDYFIKQNQYTDEINSNFASNIDDEKDFMECDKCKKKILIWNMPEHSDYHYALEIAQLDKQVANTSEDNNEQTTNSIVKKTATKRLNNELNDKSNIKKQKKNEQQTNGKKIESYFKKL